MPDPIINVNVNITELKTALKDVTASIDRLNQSIDKMGQTTTKNMSNASQGTKKLTQDTKALNAEYAKLEKEFNRIQKQSKGLDKNSQKYRENLKEVRRLNGEMKKLRQQGAGAIEKVTQSQSKLNKQVSLGRQLFLRLKSVMLTVFGAYAIIQGIRNTINTIKDFELGVARLQAITGKTREEIESLTNAAKVLSQTSIFNASEITKVQVQLAKFGFTVKEIENATEGIINLATATGEELEPAATLVSSVLRGLGLEAKETARIVDVLGRSFTSSALDANKFRESAKFIVPLARQMGWSIEQVAATLGKLADSGISGSLAGTGLRQTFIELWNSSSDLSKILGAGIKTFDEFTDALIRVKEEGVSVDAVLEAVPTRAKTMFSVLLNGAEDIKTFAKSIEDAGGAIEEMADVQLDTLAYQLQRVTSAWQAFVLSVQENGGWMTDFFEGMADTFAGLARYIDPTAAAMLDAARNSKAFLDNISELSNAGKIASIGEQVVRLQEKISNYTALIGQFEDGVKRMKVGDEWINGVDELTAKITQFEEEIRILTDAERDFAADDPAKLKIEKLLKIFEQLKGEGVESLQAFDDAYKQVASELGDDLVAAFQAGEEEGYDVIGRILESVKGFYRETKKLMIEDKELWDKIQAEILEDDIKNKRKLYALLKQLELERNENAIQSELERELNILEINAKYARLNYELDLQSGKLTAAQAEATNSLLLEIEETLQRERLELKKKYYEKDLEAAEATWDDFFALEKARNETELQLLKNQGASKEELWQKDLENAIRLKEVEILLYEEAGKSAELLYEQLAKMQAELLGGFDSKETESKLKDVVKVYKDFAQEIIDSLQTIADAQVENTSRLVDDLDTRIAETQRALDQEIALYTDGYANNVTAKRQELAELKQARDQAIRDREVAIRRQQQLEAISQAANLFSAVAKTINTYSAIPGVGYGIAAGVVAAFLALFKTAQTSIKNITQFADGGEINGNSHARGGVVLEAEGGEFIINKRAYSKYHGLVNAINEDNLPTLDASVLNNTTFEKRGGDVVLENAIWNKMYDLWDKNLNGEKVEVQGNKKIITKGIRKRIIRNV